MPRWVGIDEAGYGPNLGPLVMTAVTAEGPEDRPPDLWGDLPQSVSRAGGPADRLWIDDSKALYKPGKGRERLETACLAAIAATGASLPGTLGELLKRLGAGSLDEAEWTPWLGSHADLDLFENLDEIAIRERLDRKPLEGAPWRLVAVRSVVVGPLRFNQGLERSGSNKAIVHFGAFAELLREVWDRAGEGVPTFVRGDKHGGRHFYAGPLADALPDSWVTPECEGPDRSQYTVRGPGRQIQVTLEPRADADDGLVALASIVSKALRERWMDAFNAYWLACVPGLKPTAGYPVDAARFRLAIEAESRDRGLEPMRWWRSR